MVIKGTDDKGLCANFTFDYILTRITGQESNIPPISKSKIQNSYARGDFGLGGIGFYHIFEIYQHKSTNNLTVIISEGNSPC